MFFNLSKKQATKNTERLTALEDQLLSSSRNITFKRIRKETLFLLLTLIVISALTIAGQSLINSTLSVHADDSAKINIGGRQRMLCNRYSLQVQSMITAYSLGNLTLAQSYNKSAQTTLALIQASRSALINGNSDPAFELPVETNATILNFYKNLTTFENAFQNQAANLIFFGSLTNNSNDPTTVTNVVNTIQIALNFVTNMNAIVNQYQFISDDRIYYLRVIEIVLLVCTLLVMVVEAYVVVVPSFRHMNLLLKEEKIRKAAEKAEEKAKQIEATFPQ